MTPERKEHLRSLTSVTPYLAEVLDALDVEEKREREARREYDEAAKGWEEALARAEAAETAAATAWKRFEEMREAYKTNSRNYGGVVRERDAAVHQEERAVELMAASHATAVRCAADASRAEKAREEAERKLQQVADEWKTKDAEVRHANAKLRAMRAGADDVWFWQGRGDDPQSLTCPVVMQPDTLRAMLEIIAAFQAYIHEWGIEHATVTVPADEGDDYPCPEDDTCTCPHVARINAAFAAYRTDCTMKPTPPFPTPPTPAHLDNPPGKTLITEYFPTRVVPPTTACKHHPHGCEVCGTTDQRDALHTTRGGRGVVGRLKRSRAK